jgi:hypothetical protein
VTPRGREGASARRSPRQSPRPMTRRRSTPTPRRRRRRGRRTPGYAAAPGSCGRTRPFRGAGRRDQPPRRGASRTRCRRRR